MGELLVPVTAAMSAAFAAIHLLVGRLRFIDTTPRSKWLSFSGGVAVSYVFLHVMPELGAHSMELAEAMHTRPVVAEGAIYALALAGLVVFYGLERHVKLSRARSRKDGQGDRIESELLGLHVGAYAFFNLLIGYLLLHREEAGAWALGLYFGAMALHFLTADYGMRKDHGDAYDAWGRWVLAAAVLAGWGAGLAITLSSTTVAGLFAFLAGSIVLSVLKEELPEERQSFFLPFLGGVIAYGAVVLVERIFV